MPICLSDKSKSQEVVAALSTHLIQPYGQFLCLGTDGQSTLTSVYNTSVKTHEDITPFFLMNGFRNPHLSKLIPFSGYLPNRQNADTTNYVRSFIKMREAMSLIHFKRRQLHLKRLGLQDNFQENLRIGDLVLITRSVPRGPRAGHKLRPVNHT